MPMPKDKAKRQQLLDEWIKDRPQVIKDVVAKYPPTNLYELRSTKQKVAIAEYFEDGTISVTVTRDYNITFMEKCVFGIDPASLTPLCDLYDAGEHELEWDAGVRALIDQRSAEMKAVLPTWHEQIPKNITGQDRAKLIAAKIQEFETRVDAEVHELVTTRN